MFFLQAAYEFVEEEFGEDDDIPELWRLVWGDDFMAAVSVVMVPQDVCTRNRPSNILHLGMHEDHHVLVVVTTSELDVEEGEAVIVID